MTSWKKKQKFTELLQLASTTNSLIIKKPTSTTNFSIEIKEMIRDKRKARRNWQRTRDPERKKVFNKINQKLKRLLYETRNKGIAKYLQGLTADVDTNYSLWRATKRIRRPIINLPPIKKQDGSWARSSQEKADFHVDHLENVFQPHDFHTDVSDLVTVESREATPIKHVSLKEIQKEISCLKSKKAFGYDSITVRMLKNLSAKGIMKLTHLFNASIR